MSFLDGNSQVPFISKYEIVSHVEGLLNEYWDGIFPVDVERICDYLGIAIIPVARLANEFRIDAFISADFKTIYVDAEKYKYNSYRYRFSVAHELGHYLLHREFFSSRVWSFEDWLGSSSGEMNGAVEFQANYFAGSLLAPEDELLKVLDTRFGGSLAKNYYRAGRIEADRILAGAQKVFGVSGQVINRRIRDAVYGWTIN